MRRWTSAWLWGVLAAACGTEPAPRTGPPNLILISIDTLRADRLGIYGYGRDTSPALDRFAAGARVFERAYAPSPWTLPSHVSMLSGLSPSEHGVDQPTYAPGRDTPLLAERLQAAGYYTFGRTDGGWLSADFGFDRGFLSFHAERRGLEAALAETEEAFRAAHGERPFFGFVHTYDVHCPYTPGEPFASMFATPGAQSLETEGRCGNPHFNARGFTAAEALFLSDRYDGGVRKADQALGAFLAALEADGLLENTVVAITSDHGEAFGERGRIGHEGSLHREVLWIPLLIRAPGLEPGPVAGSVDLSDLTPTLLELLDVEVPPELTDRSLLSPGGGGAAVYGEVAWNGAGRSWVRGDLHLIEEGAELQLFDWASDPLERRNLAPGDPDGARKLLETLRAEVPSRVQRRPLRALPSPETGQALQDLGYAGD